MYSESLGSIACVNVYVIRSEIARPNTSSASTRAEFHANGNKIAQHAAVHLSFTERVFDAAAARENPRKINIRAARIDFDSRTTGGSENASPIRIGAREHCFHQRRSGDRACHLLRHIVACSTA